MKIIIEYIKDRKNQKIGLVSATYSLDDNIILVGFSLCNINKDKFKKDLAFNIAKNRMTKYNKLNIKDINIPYSVKKKLLKFIPRIKRYYKDKEFSQWVNNLELNPLNSYWYNL